MEMKFSVNDKLYIVDYEKYEIKTACTVCDETGYVFLKDERFSCPECHGKKYTSKFAWGFRVKSNTYTVTGFVSEGSKNYYFMKELGDVKVEEKDIFKDFESAKKECQSRGKVKYFGTTKYNRKSDTRWSPWERGWNPW